MLNKVIDGYKVVSYLGKGGFGLVFKAEKDGQFYAIKFIRTDIIRNDIDLQRIEREIAALSKVDSPHAVKYFEHGFYEEAYVKYRYIVMEYLDGKTLREVLSERAVPYEQKEAIEITKSILAGLTDIHAKNIVHRDLKPENIFVTSDGIKILDYGLSKIIDYSSITQTGAALGTFFYMSPEQIRGNKPVNHTSDFYSIGVMLYEMLTSKILFYPASDAEIIYKTINEKPPFPSTLNPKISNNVENAILKLLEKDSFKRYKTIPEIIDALEKKSKDRDAAKADRLKFYPRFIQTDTEITKAYLDKHTLDGADFPINLHAGYKQLHGILRSKASSMDFFADPGTNRLTFSNFTETSGLVKLPYAPSGFDVLDIADFPDRASIRLYAEKVIDLQVANGCTVLTAPFFWFDNVKDDWFTINIKLLREGSEYVRERYPQYQYSGAICTQAEILCRKSERETIIEDYGNCDIDFLQLYVDKIYEDTTEVQLFNFITTGLSIKEYSKAKIIACRVPSIGLGLLTVGFDAVTSGLAVLDSFSKGVITKEGEARSTTRHYFPDLLKAVTTKSRVEQDIISQEAALHKQLPHLSFGLTCRCDGCVHDTLTDVFQKPRLHFLCARNVELSEINALSSKDRKKHFMARIDKAYELQTQLISNGIKLDSPKYLQSWKEILGKF